MGRCKNSGHQKNIDFCHTLFIGWIILHKLTSVLYIIVSWVGLAWHSRDMQKPSVQWPNSVWTSGLENFLDHRGIYSAFPVKYCPRSKLFPPDGEFATSVACLAASVISALRMRVTENLPASSKCVFPKCRGPKEGSGSPHQDILSWRPGLKGPHNRQPIHISSSNHAVQWGQFGGRKIAVWS